VQAMVCVGSREAVDACAYDDKVRFFHRTERGIRPGFGESCYSISVAALAELYI
jgi:hypothetical protein